MDDLVQEGTIGLIKAVDRFNPDKGIQFDTYATHFINGEIRHYLRDLGRLIHEPGWHFELRVRINRAADLLAQQTDHAPTPEQIAAHLGVKAEAVRDVVEKAQTLYVDSLDAPAGDEADGETDTVLDRYDAGAAGESGGEGRVEDALFLEDALPQLKTLERQAVKLFFFDELSKSDIARRLDISVNYACYLIKRGTGALRRILKASDPVIWAPL